MSGFFCDQAFRAHSHDRRPIIFAGAALLFLISSATLILLFGNASAVQAVTVLPAEPAHEMSVAEILVPTMDIRPGTRLEPEMFRTVSYPALAVSREIIRSLSDLRGQYAVSLMVAGQPVHSKFLSPTKLAVSGPIRDEIPAGFVAATIRVNELSANAGLVRPGDFVNVSWTGRKNGELVSSILMQNIKVLVSDRDVDPNWKPGMPIPNTITLLVTLVDYKRLQVAQVNGTLGLALKGRELEIDPRAAEVVLENQIAGSTDVKQSEPECRNTVSMCKSQSECEQYCVGPQGKLERMIKVNR